MDHCYPSPVRSLHPSGAAWEEKHFCSKERLCVEMKCNDHTNSSASVTAGVDTRAWRSSRLSSSFYRVAFDSLHLIHPDSIAAAPVTRVIAQATAGPELLSASIGRHGIAPGSVHLSVTLSWRISNPVMLASTSSISLGLRDDTSTLIGTALSSARKQHRPLSEVGNPSEAPEHYGDPNHECDWGQ
ncbi:hypothetical protein BDV96DRAFT_636474 [Lophiotrema nucula]|uniref:Uncharacterized protein n=1 Tax=Lophiotrema nucula TaxID=690887 RepID=A0A6A5YSI0_9PLEO|nr:hypothetical protein BDV96DRAFT_636474 [Lophiotrema nucula]